MYFSSLFFILLNVFNNSIQFLILFLQSYNSTYHLLLQLSSNILKFLLMKLLNNYQPNFIRIVSFYFSINYLFFIFCSKIKHLYFLRFFLIVFNFLLQLFSFILFSPTISTRFFFFASVASKNASSILTNYLFIYFK